MTDEVEAAYLSAPDRPGGSGYAGGMQRWEQARRIILAAVDRRGDFLDIGCANGLLWSRSPPGRRRSGSHSDCTVLEMSQALAQQAREALPSAADRIHVGDVMDWIPPRRFDFVRTEWVYARRQRAAQGAGWNYI